MHLIDKQYLVIAEFNPTYYVWMNIICKFLTILIDATVLIFVVVYIHCRWICYIKSRFLYNTCFKVETVFLDDCCCLLLMTSMKTVASLFWCNKLIEGFRGFWRWGGWLVMQLLHSLQMVSCDAFRYGVGRLVWFMMYNCFASVTFLVCFERLGVTLWEVSFRQEWSRQANTYS